MEMRIKTLLNEPQMMKLPQITKELKKFQKIKNLKKMFLNCSVQCFKFAGQVSNIFDFISSIYRS